MEIGRKDVNWSYAASFMKIASQALLLPIVLKILPSELIGIWTIFITINSFSILFDFGFSPSFTRNVTYVFSGVGTLKVNGFESARKENQTVDYGLLKGLISAMRWFYLRIAVILFLLLATIGTHYIYLLLQNYNGEHREVYIAWALLCGINTYSLYTLYYDSLMLGKGLVKKTKQIIIIGQSVSLIFAAILLLAGYGLVAIVSAQVLAIIIRRWMSYRAFFTSEIKQSLNNIMIRSQKEVLKAIYPNAFKIGLTILGSFMVRQSAIFIGSLYLSLEDIASYGITYQLIAVMAVMSEIYMNTFQPKIAHLRITDNNQAIKKLYLKGLFLMLLTYIAGGMGLMIFGEWALRIMGSNTQLMPQLLILAAIVVSFLTSNQNIAELILLSKNEVPFFKASLLTGAFAIVLLVLLFNLANPGLWIMVAAPGLALAVYQNWKWPVVVIKELGITLSDIYKGFIRFIN